MSATNPVKLDDEVYLRRAFEVAKRARVNGNHPFGAILVDRNGSVLIESENGYLPDRDMTAHAERLLATSASKAFGTEFLAHCTIYVSAEPCAMCAGAIYWAGKLLTGNHGENPTLDLPCRTVFAAGQRPVEVLGPMLADEATALHVGAWDTDGKK